jgi:serine/threonine protein kinase
VREWVADYQVLSPVDGEEAGRTFVARSPRRLDAERPSLAVTLLGTGPGTWTAATRLLPTVATASAHGVVRIWEVGRDVDGETYVSTDYCAEGSLAGSRPGDRSVLPVLAAAARAAHQLHEAGVAHGDIRPATVLRSGGAGFLAAPTARLRGEPGQTAVAAPATRLAALDPAVVRGDPPSRASDLWSLAVTAHFALTGQWVHPGIQDADALTALQRLLFEPPVTDRALGRGEAAVIARNLSPDPANRSPSAAHLAADLEALAGGVQ